MNGQTSSKNAGDGVSKWRAGGILVEERSCVSQTAVSGSWRIPVVRALAGSREGASRDQNDEYLGGMLETWAEWEHTRPLTFQGVAQSAAQVPSLSALTL